MRARVKTSVVWPTIISSAVALMVGCDGASDDLGGGGGATGGPQSGKVIPQREGDKASDFFETSNSYPAYVASHFCTLSFFRGPFAGAIDKVYLDWQNEWDSWQLHHAVGAGDTREASAVCTNWDNFRTASGGFHMVSPGVTATTGNIGFSEARTDEWQGDAMLFLRGIAGVYESNDEFSRTFQSTTVAGVNQLYVHDSTTSAVTTKGYSHAIFVGVPQVQLVKTINYNSSTGTYVRGNVSSGGDVKEYPISSTSGFNGYWMSSVHDGFCGLTRVGGRLDGAEERVRLYPNGQQWYYRVWAHEGKTVVAKARCMAYDQR